MLLKHLDTVIAFTVVMLGISLAIMVLTQMFAAVTGLRGTNLRWGLERLLPALAATFHLDLDPKAKTVEILHHPLISDSAFSTLADRLPRIAQLVNWFKPLKIVVDRWRLGSAIRPEELAAILHIRPESAASIENLAGQIQALAPAQAADARQLAQQIIDRSKAVGGDFELWFNAAMDRISQRFALHTRLFTVSLAVLIAFGMHIDALALFKRLLADDQLRATLVSSADAMSKQAEGVLGTSSRVPTAYSLAMKTLREGTDPEAQKYAELTKSLPEPPPTFASSVDAETWLRQNLHVNTQTDQIVESYRKILSRTLSTAVVKLSDQLREIGQTLGQTEFQLIESPYKPWDYCNRWPRNRHFWGVFGAAVLLSLGAPFWFNALKSLTNLRPILAQKQEKEQAAKA
ncbi:MAG: hypothetical protein HY238_16120 [Acidobacteria bacterium]|nr:hypothetical protein [Acidobacteriota bacterium]